MGTQGEALAARVQQVSEQLVSTIEGCPDAKWSAKTLAEGWSVAAAAHHAAGAFTPTSQLAIAIAMGMPLPPITMEGLNANNAQHAQKFASCSKGEAVELARKDSAAAVAALGGLSDEQLANSTVVSFLGNQTFSAAQVAEMFVIGHANEHLQSIIAAG